MDMSGASANKIREPAFARRLEQACDANPHCPPMFKGRLTWLSAELSKRLKKTVTTQTVSRWMKGEVKARTATNVALAELLGVDSTWLYHGIEPDLSPRERRARNAMADGAVNIVAGLVQMDGGYPAFPADGDTHAEREHVDLYAVIKGAKYSFHVALGIGHEGQWEFSVPTIREDILIVGVIREGFSFRMVEISEDVITEYGSAARGAAVTVTIPAEAIQAAEITSFAKRV